jgi:hypothetical protein
VQVLERLPLVSHECAAIDTSMNPKHCGKPQNGHRQSIGLELARASDTIGDASRTMLIVDAYIPNGLGEWPQRPCFPGSRWSPLALAMSDSINWAVVDQRRRCEQFLNVYLATEQRAV